MKGAERSEIESAIRAVRRGDAVLAAAVARRALAGLGRSDPSNPFPQLTPREFEVLAHLAAGKSNKEIAEKLGISPNTVKTQVASLYQKLEVQRRTQAVQKARELALIP